MTRRLPVVVQRKDAVTHYVRAKSGLWGGPSIPDHLVMSLCGFVRSDRHEDAVPGHSPKLVGCRRCLHIAQKHPERVRVEEVREEVRLHQLPTPVERPWLTVAEVADITGEGEKAIRAAIAADTLPSLRVGRYVRIPTAKLRQQLGIDPD